MNKTFDAVTTDIGLIIPGVRLVAKPARRYQVRHYQTGRVIGWRNSIVGASRLAADYHRILDTHHPHADGTPTDVKI